ncbi:DUF2076 domain-containing protein [Polymorphospora rubra]|uniref:Uncharacterized protein n=1 Tax=Polymorphospora rubra TaxID=338584 RepID=A0A810MWD5_9ACTN|nr:DUF2076 domain-containing protein [Polymorphospora rubra]BCJ65352.1 hypothetical protein Prubr_23730 [Polymorphospora rubra]
MSIPMNPGQPGQATRPSTVTISGYLLYAVAAILAITGLLSLVTIGPISDVYSESYAGTELEGTESFVVVGVIATLVVNILLAIGLAVLAVLNLKGKNVARIITWVVGGLGVCCLGFGLIGSSATSSFGAPTTGDLPDPAEIQERTMEALPGWYNPVSLTLTVIALLALLAALILLALPASNEYFRRPSHGGGEPPLPGSSYPGYPQTPGSSHPGYPQTPGSDPGYPQAPGSDPGYPPAPGSNPPPR